MADVFRLELFLDLPCEPRQAAPTSVPSLPIAHGVLEGPLGPVFGTLKRAANILQLFSRELPQYAQSQRAPG